MARYLYTGIQTAISLPPKKEGDPAVEVPLIPHTEVELPADLPYVQRLVHKGLLQAVEVPKVVKSRSKQEAE